MPVTIPPVDFLPLTPVLITAITVILLMLGDLVVPPAQKSWLALLALLGLVAAAVSAISLWGLNSTAFNNGIIADNYGLLVALIILFAASLAILLSVNFVRERGLEVGEYLSLLLAAVTGMVLMALANDLIVIFLALEILSLSLYLLSGFWKRNGASLEAGMKYFLLGAFSSAFFLYGIAFLFGATGNTNLPKIANVLGQPNAGNNSLVLIGAGLLLVGFGFKVALVPFQWWTPDVYEGAPTPVTAFMSVATKTAAFAAFFRAFLVAMPLTAWDWRVVLAALAVLTMSVGNIAALVQTNIKRMLAYSSIAHAGYILIALVAGGSAGAAAALFYLLAYTMMNLGAFGAVIAMGEGERERVNFADLAGVASQKPLLAAALAICLLSLAGFPPFAGFVGKFFVFSAAIAHGWIWLAIVGVLNSLISVYFYLGPIVRMYMSPPVLGWGETKTPVLVGLAVAIAVIGTIALGLVPVGAMSLAQAAMLK
jgi:NADH-quinone oxidoreductase subunit N